MLSLYEYPTLILLIYTCAITLATDSPSKIPTIHHKNLLKHRAPPPDSGFDYSSLVACNKDTVSSNFPHTQNPGGARLAGESCLPPPPVPTPNPLLHILCGFLAMSYQKMLTGRVT